MSEELAYYLSLGNSIDETLESQMFGKPFFKIKGKAFICFFDNSMVFKLQGDKHAQALNLSGSVLFDPSGKKRPMKEWVQISFDHKEEWKKFAHAACKYVASNN